MLKYFIVLKCVNHTDQSRSDRTFKEAYKTVTNSGLFPEQTVYQP